MRLVDKFINQAHFLGRKTTQTKLLHIFFKIY